MRREVRRGGRSEGGETVGWEGGWEEDERRQGRKEEREGGRELQLDGSILQRVSFIPNSDTKSGRM